MRYGDNKGSLGPVDSGKICREELVLLVTSDSSLTRASTINRAKRTGIGEVGLIPEWERYASSNLGGGKFSIKGILRREWEVSLSVEHDEMHETVVE